MKLRRVFADSVFDATGSLNGDPQVFVEVWVGSVVLIHLALRSRVDADYACGSGDRYDALHRAVGELVVRADCASPSGRRLTATLDVGWNLIREITESDAIRLGIAAMDVAWREVYERVFVGNAHPDQWEKA